MPRIPGVNHQDAVRALEQAGFHIVRQGKHIVMTDGTRQVTIPRHNPIKAFTMGGIAKDAAIRRPVAGPFDPDFGQFRQQLSSLLEPAFHPFTPLPRGPLGTRFTNNSPGMPLPVGKSNATLRPS